MHPLRSQWPIVAYPRYSIYTRIESQINLRHMNSPTTEESENLLLKSHSLEDPHDILASKTEPSRISSFLVVIVLIFNCSLVLASVYLQILAKKSLSLKSRDIDMLPRPDPFAGLQKL
jgi:hypothetical protein